MPVGLKVSGDVFQERLDRVLRLVPGVHGITDDIVIHGAPESTHDGTVLVLCKTARLNNLSLNTIQVIMTLPVLAYFDKTKKHTIQCNASKKGLGAVLLQESKPVRYVSRALTETEQRYSNIERELLAIVFALERLIHYTFGRTITVQSKHQPLQIIWKKSIVSASPRLQRLLLRLAHYDINIEFLWGKENVIADALSRVYPLQSNNSKIKDSKLMSSQYTTSHRVYQLAKPDYKSSD